MPCQGYFHRTRQMRTLTLVCILLAANLVAYTTYHGLILVLDDGDLEDDIEIERLSAPEQAHLPAASNREKVYSNQQNLKEPNCGDIVVDILKLKDSDKELLRWFRPKIRGRNLCSIMLSTYTLADALRVANVSFFMCAGTLLGSWRHHGLVPWDDDVDIYIDFKQQQTAYRALMDLHPGFVLNVKQKKRWKFFRITDQPISRVSWRYPFVDISFLHSNTTHMWDHDIKNYPDFVFPKDWTFPLINRPFLGYKELPAPRLTERYLRRNFDIDSCYSGNYSHEKEVIIGRFKRHTVPCDRLQPFLPFVQRTPLQNRKGCNETLVQYGKALGHFVATDYDC